MTSSRSAVDRRSAAAPHAAAWRWIAAAGLVLGNFFLHKPISDVCDALFARIGRGPYELVTLAAVAGLSLAGAILLLRCNGGAVRSALAALLAPRRLLAMLAIGAGMAGAQRWLLVSNVELIHFPQFGLLAALLLAAGLPPRGAFLLATAAGALDEAYQRVVIYQAVPNVYFDWNDVVLNALGAALAVLLAPPLAAPRVESRWRLLSAAALAGFALALWWAPPRVAALPSFPYWTPVLGRAMTGRDYHVMAGSEGVGALLIIWAAVLFGTATPPFEKGGTGGIAG